MQTIRLAAISLATTCVCVLAACGIAPFGRHGVHHALTYRNDGSASVREVAIQYGEYVLPVGSLHHEMRIGAARTEIRTLPVPKSVEISWRSDDGAVHRGRCALSTAVGKSERFSGFEFAFRDQVGEVRLVREELVNGKYNQLLRSTLCQMP
jgi:hypothetical protein